MNFIMIPLIIGIICAGIYGLFELFVRKKERLAIIEKIGDKLEPSAFDAKIGLPRLSTNLSFSSLKAGCLLVGIGLGIFFLSISTVACDNYEMRSAVYGASVLLFGGLGLIVAFILEMKLSKDKDK